MLWKITKDKIKILRKFAKPKQWRQDNTMTLPYNEHEFTCYNIVNIRIWPPQEF